MAGYVKSLVYDLSLRNLSTPVVIRSYPLVGHACPTALERRNSPLFQVPLLPLPMPLCRACQPLYDRVFIDRLLGAYTVSGHYTRHAGISRTSL